MRPDLPTAPEANDRYPPLSPNDRTTLRDVADASLRHGLEFGRPLPVDAAAYPEALQAPRSSFVTLRREGQLRGCVGSYEAPFPLVEDVARNAFSAAFRDPRFRPLQLWELEDLEVEISLLSPPEPMEVTTEEELLKALRPGVDGLILEEPPHRGLFLPQVWDTLPRPKDFLENLRLKAGLPGGYWSSRMRFRRFVVEKLEAADGPHAGP